MLGAAAKSWLLRTLADAGVSVGGARPWDLRVVDERFYRRVFECGSLGAGEAYMHGWWECEALDQLTERLLAAPSGARLTGGLPGLLLRCADSLVNRQAGRRSRQVGALHYDLRDEMFAHMLGESMNYSCAYWRTATSLDEAQRHKMELIARKLCVSGGERVLDIGCGWGGLARYLAERRGCTIVGVTISRNQAEFGRGFCAGLPVTILELDYRDPELRRLGPFDRVVSVGMFEHVGRHNHAKFFEIARQALAARGLLLLQTFGRTVPTNVDAWTDRYIFPNSYIPTMSDLATAVGFSMIMEDWHNFGADYDRTIMAWWARFEDWARCASPAPAPSFVRMWRYYLATYAACFRVRNRLQLWQIVFSPAGVRGGYPSCRSIGAAAQPRAL